MFEPQNIAITLNALAKLDCYDEDVMRALCARIVDVAANFNAQDIANGLNSLVHRNHVGTT